MITRLPGILVVVLLLTSGCSSTGREQVEILQTLSTRTTALNSRDIAQYLSVISTRYSDKGKNFAQLKEDLEKNFRDFEHLSYEADIKLITADGNSARADGSYRMKVRALGKEMTLNGTEHLRLAKEPEGWKIIAGI